MSRTRKFAFASQETTEAIYKFSQEMALKRNTYLMSQLKVDPIHRDSLGYWSSLADILRHLRVPYELPNVTNAIVVPFYHANFQLSHIRLIYMKNEGYEIQSIGPSPNGWFNLLNSSRDFKIHEAHDKTKRLKVYDSLLTTLSKDSGVHSDIINTTNLKSLLQLSRVLAVYGSNRFVRAFEHIEGFDITVGETGLSIGDFCNKQFILQDLVGLDLRAVVPAATNYAAALPFYERNEFNTEFMKIFKLDLRNVAPFVFEHMSTEKRLMTLLTNRLAIDFTIVLLDSRPLAREFVVELKHSLSGKRIEMVLDEKLLAQYFSRFYGDLVDFCYEPEIGGLPSSYSWNEATRTRLPRASTFDYVSKAFYMAVLGLLKETDG